MRNYRLDGHTPVPMTYEEWLERMNSPESMGSHVAKTEVYLRGAGDGKVYVSTVFLYFDHGWGDGPPILFETMIFPDDGLDRPLPEESGYGDDSNLSDYQERYSTWEQAEEGHKRAVALVHKALQQ